MRPRVRFDVFKRDDFTYTDLLGAAEVKDAMDIAHARFDGRIVSNAVRYFVGVCKRKAEEHG